MKQSTVLTIFFTVFCLFIVGCSRSSKGAIIGKWQAPDNKTRIEFFSDGAMQINNGARTNSGKYAFLDDGRLKIEFPELENSNDQTLQVSVNGDVMTTIDENGKKEELKRIK